MATQVSIRLQDTDVETLDKLAVKLSRPGFPALRSDVLRMAIARGIVAIEAEIKKNR